MTGKNQIPEGTEGENARRKLKYLCEPDTRGKGGGEEHIAIVVSGNGITMVMGTT